jgi:hypothetical protein
MVSGGTQQKMQSKKHSFAKEFSYFLGRMLIIHGQQVTMSLVSSGKQVTMSLVTSGQQAIMSLVDSV